MTSFVAIDFETCLRTRQSPIQVGVVRVIDGQVGKPYTSAVMPPQGYRSFDPSLIAVHGLTPDYIEGAPEWPEILERLVKFATHEGQLLPLVAHNAVFERSVINATTVEVGLHTPAFKYLCTLKAARALLRTPNHKLPTVAQHLCVEQLNHHDAGDDALVAAQVALALEQQRPGIITASHL